MAHELLDVLDGHSGVLQEGRVGSPERVHGELNAQFLREPYHTVPEAFVAVWCGDAVRLPVVQKQVVRNGDLRMSSKMLLDDGGSPGHPFVDETLRVLMIVYPGELSLHVALSVDIHPWIAKPGELQVGYLLASEAHHPSQMDDVGVCPGVQISS